MRSMLSSLLIPALLATLVSAGVARKDVVTRTNLGCFVDTVSPRTFTAASIPSSDSMTTEGCSAFCEGLGYAYSATEWSRECYCSPTPATLTLPSTACDMTCTGNPAEICGGSGAISVTYNAAIDAAYQQSQLTNKDFTPQGCFVDNYPATRVLSGAQTTSGAMTVERCVNFCNQKGFPIAGVEYGIECYCGSQMLTDGSYGVKTQSAACSYACAGDSTQKCGGSNAVDVYANGVVLTVSPPLPAKFTADKADGSCASDYTPGNGGARTLAGISTTSWSMTPEFCSTFCAGYMFYGIEYSVECYCGDAIAASAVVATNCTSTCSGNPSAICGGGYAMNIYANKLLTSSSSSTLATTTSTSVSTSMSLSTTASTSTSSSSSAMSTTTSLTTSSTVTPTTTIAPTTSSTTTTSTTTTAPSPVCTGPPGTFCLYGANAAGNRGQIPNSFSLVTPGTFSTMFFKAPYSNQFGNAIFGVFSIAPSNFQLQCQGVKVFVAPSTSQSPDPIQLLSFNSFSKPSDAQPVICNWPVDGQKLVCYATVNARRYDKWLYGLGADWNLGTGAPNNFYSVFDVIVSMN